MALNNGSRFSIAAKHRPTRATRAQVKICCKKLLNTFGIFVDRGSRVTSMKAQGIGDPHVRTVAAAGRR